MNQFKLRLKETTRRAREYGLRVSAKIEKFILVDDNQPRLSNIYGEEIIGDHAEFNSLDELEQFLDEMDGTPEED